MRLESKIADFAREQGVELVGLAGPDRLDGPPSLDPSFVLSGAKSIVSLVVPMDVPAVEDFLSKRTHVSHNLDQTRWNQKLMRIGSRLARYIRAQGHRAAAVPSNSDYRKSPDPWSMHPSFSHRLGAVASGVAGMGWSGNVKCEEYGAATYLGTVVTDAVLESSPRRYSPRHFADGLCRKCRRCAPSCVAQMFSANEEEYVLINGELHPRGKRMSVDLCEIACFGLHSLSQDKTWSTWGVNWISDWMERPPGSLSPLAARACLWRTGGSAGDSTARFDLIRRIGNIEYPKEMINAYLDKRPRDLPYNKRLALLRQFAHSLGAARPGDLRTDLVLTCGNCSLICGPDNQATAKRFSLLKKSGIVAPGPGGEPVVAKTYEEAVALRKKHLPRIPAWRKAADGARSAALFRKLYLGVNARSQLKGRVYALKLANAVRKKAPGHKDHHPN
ncbi:MAG: hypothetical protein JRI97_07060 [Deltaproteobacteria bacterium]|nr:hypothetical protein [Deltaproteobacteria bacterium]